MNYIGISENRLHHIMGVARKAYKIAKEMGYGENFCRRCFMLGWIHDVGYEFAKDQAEHPDVSAEMFRNLINNNQLILDEMDFTEISKASLDAYQAIKDHGRYPSNITEMSVEYKILNMADMQVDSNGKEVSVDERLEDIKERYGEYSNQYLTACDICYYIGLTPINFAGNIT